MDEMWMKLADGSTGSAARIREVPPKHRPGADPGHGRVFNGFSPDEVVANGSLLLPEAPQRHGVEPLPER
jgi:hypothetical protein